MSSRGVNKVIVSLYENGLSIPQVSEILGKSRSTVRYHIMKAGSLRSRGDGVRLAAKQGRLSVNKGVSREFTNEWKRNISTALMRSWACRAKGVSLKPSGYVAITRGENKGRSQHSVVAEGVIGRKLKRDECVHHIDGNRSNNNPSNLQVMTRSEHASLHALENNHARERNTLGRYI